MGQPTHCCPCLHSSPTGSLLAISQLTLCFLASGPLLRLSPKHQTASPLTFSSSISLLDIHANTTPALPGFYHSPSLNLLQLAQSLPVTTQWLVPHVAIVIHQVVGQLEFVKGHDLPHPLGTLGWRVRVEVHSARCGRVGLARHQPGRTVEGVPGEAERGRAVLALLSAMSSQGDSEDAEPHPVMRSLPGGHPLCSNCVCLRLAHSLFSLRPIALGCPPTPAWTQGLHLTLPALWVKLLFSTLLSPCQVQTCIACHPAG